MVNHVFQLPITCSVLLSRQMTAPSVVCMPHPQGLGWVSSPPRAPTTLQTPVLTAWCWFFWTGLPEGRDFAFHLCRHTALMQHLIHRETHRGFVAVYYGGLHN